jgi:hypothetical protein
LVKLKAIRASFLARKAVPIFQAHVDKISAL